MKRRLISLALVCVLAFSLGTAAMASDGSQIPGDSQTAGFFDVPGTHWAVNEINAFSRQGIVSGYGDGSFRPNNGVTREEFCKLLVVTFDQPLRIPDDPTFADVLPSRWSYPYVEVCKDFLTGYANPFGGLPAFHPADYATREDIAVALVRMMGFRDSDAVNPSYALQRFSDGAQISPQLVGYVSLACERGLINGYEDGTFRPSASVTRAEIVVLLNRALKQAVTDIQDELRAYAAVLYSPDGRTATITITAEAGSTVTVNGQAVEMMLIGNEYKGSYVYQFPSEGARDFSVVVSRMGRTKVIPLTARYEIGAPVIELVSCPTISETASVTIRGTVTDQSDAYPVLTVNNRAVDVVNHAWSAQLTLQEGENPVVITAANKLGKVTTVTKTIVLSSGGPAVEVSSCPVTSDTPTVTVRGTVQDANDAYPTVTVNGRDAGAAYGRWSREVTLQEGDNTVVIVAQNKLGKSTTVVRNISYIPEGPKLEVTACPSSVAPGSAAVTVQGHVSDPTGGTPAVTVNGQLARLNYSTYIRSGAWSCDVTLKPGDNTITIVAVNDAGFSTTVQRVVTVEEDAAA